MKLKPERRMHTTYVSLRELSRLASKMSEEITSEVGIAATLIVHSLRAGGKILTCGNGGSAADAQHLTGEIIGRFLFDRPPLPAITLSADTSILTAVGNDYGFENVFSRQVEGLGKSGDVLIGFSTSGKSPNILCAFQTARTLGMKTIALVGAHSNEVLEDCDVCFHVPSGITPRIQELHTALLHAICEEVEKTMFNNNLNKD